MMILDIARMGNPILRRTARAVDDPGDPAIARLTEQMAATMAAAGGVGLAAPQVSVSLRLVLFFVPEERSDDGRGLPVTVLINPQIQPLDEILQDGLEGCLSLPGLTGPVPRWRRIGYRGLGLDGRWIERDASGFHARVVQHECDHLDGRLYLSRMADIGRLAFTDELRRQQAQEEIPA